jgi:hypothetical protein
VSVCAPRLPQARRDIVGALHRLLLHTAAGQLQLEQCEDEFWDFMKARLPHASRTRSALV